jgi:hypothetical protein
VRVTWRVWCVQLNLTLACTAGVYLKLSFGGAVAFLNLHLTCHHPYMGFSNLMHSC